MKIALKILVTFIGLVVIAFVGINLKFNSLSSQKFEENLYDFTIDELVANADVELGKRIFSVRNGCIDCHGADLTGVMVMDNGAMGSIYGANITPYTLKDKTNKQIAQAIRYGIHSEGRSLRFMPSFDYVDLSIEDIAALIAYIRSVPAVEKASHENTFGPIAKMLSSFGKMPVMFPAHNIDQTKGFGSKPLEGPTEEFGKYLASSCIGCHGDNYTGGPIPGGDPKWPPASNIRLGANQEWTEAKFNEMMSTGVSPTSGNKLRMPMPIELLKQFNEEEKKALWLYLSTLK